MREFKTATNNDVSEIARLESKYIECGWSEKVIKDTIADGLSEIILLVDDGRIVGYGGYKKVLDEAEIYNIVVVEEYRRQQAASGILAEIIRRCNGAIKEIFLEVNENNAAAIALYKKFGFINAYVRKNYYSSGNALVMKLIL